jgi:hypothetical protein
MLAVSLGIIMTTLSFIVHVFILPVQDPTYIITDVIGLVPLMTGFALVLYSRLHLITQRTMLLRGLLIMIIINAFVGHVPTFVEMIALCIGKRPLGLLIFRVASYIEIVFAVQECLLASLYIYFFWAYINDVPERVKAKIKTETRITFALLVLAYLWVTFTDIMVNVLLFKRIYLARLLCFTLVYAIKLELEFLVLNRLVYISRLKGDALGNQSISISLPGTAYEMPESSSTSDPRHDNQISKAGGGRDFVTVI